MGRVLPRRARLRRHGAAARRRAPGRYLVDRPLGVARGVQRIRRANRDEYMRRVDERRSTTTRTAARNVRERLVSDLAARPSRSHCSPRAHDNVRRVRRHRARPERSAPKALYQALLRAPAYGLPVELHDTGRERAPALTHGQEPPRDRRGRDRCDQGRDGRRADPLHRVPDRRRRPRGLEGRCRQVPQEAHHAAAVRPQAFA